MITLANGIVSTRRSPPRPDPPPEPANLPPETTTEDWDDLFCAVRARLERTVGTLAAPTRTGEAVVLIRSSVLECVEALGQLQSMLAHERNRRDRLELEISDLRNALGLTL